jgi:hypothetical protein
MKLQANTSSFHTVLMLFLVTLAVRSMEPSTSVNGCGPLLKLEQVSKVHARAADKNITQRGMIHEADLDFVMCALILWGC